MRRVSSRSVLPPSALAALALILSGCATGDATFGGPEDETGSGTPALECEAPPAPPAEVPTFTQDDLPDGL